MRDIDSKMDQHRNEKEEKRHKLKFSWSWFRHRRKGNKIDRRTQIDNDMKTNWAELPATLRRKHKLSQHVLDEFMKDPEPEQKIEDLYSEVKKISNKNQKPEKVVDGSEENGSERGSLTQSQSSDKSVEGYEANGSDMERVDLEVGKEDTGRVDLQEIPEPKPEPQEEKPCVLVKTPDIEVNTVNECKPLENSMADEVTIKIGKIEEIVVEVVQHIETKTTEERLKLELPSNNCNESDGDLWLEREQQRVMQLLHHAVSEDSLLVISSASEDSSSEDELLDDSGTDINNPSSSSSCTNETFMSIQNPNRVSLNDDENERKSIVETLLAIQSPLESAVDKEDNRDSIVQSFIHSQNPNPTDPNERLAENENSQTNVVSDSIQTEIPITPTQTTQNDKLASCDIYTPTSSKPDSLLTSSEDSSSQENDTEDSGISKPKRLFLRSELIEESLDIYDLPMSIPRVGLHHDDRKKSAHNEKRLEDFKTEEETAMAYYDSVVQEGQKDNSFQVEIEVHNYRSDDKDDGEENGDQRVVNGDPGDDGVGGDGFEEQEEKQLSLDFIEEEDFSKLVDRMQFSTGAKWKKALLMQTLGRKPKGMATIVEETSLDEETTPEQLTVREILRRFEELGCKMLPADEKSATLKEIHDTLRCLEEKVRSYESKLKAKQQLQSTPLQSKNVPRITNEPYHPGHQNPTKVPAIDNWTGRGQHQAITTHAAMSHQHAITSTTQAPPPQHAEETHESMGQHDGKHSLLQFAINHFRASPEKFEMLKTADGSISGSLKVLESHKNTKKKDKSKKDKDKDKDKDKGSNKENDWTWKEQVDLVKFSNAPVEQSLLRLDSPELSELAVECFTSVMRYMGDLPMTTDLSEVKCVYTILMHCHKHESLRDEVYCQLMKQTTNNKSIKPDSCQRGWRLFSIVAAYFTCSDTLKPYLFKYLETAAYDKRRAYHGTATVCLQNLRKTFRHGGRKNVPSVEELTAISAGRNSKRQIYRLPGGSERVVNTKSTTVVQDVIEEMCAVINVQTAAEMEEFSLYCIVEGDTFTMPLARDEYILDVTTELHKNQQVFYLIFCRSVWHFPLRLDSQLYIEVVFNQIAPDYLEGLLLVMPGEQLDQDVIYDIAKMAALLHRAADMTHLPTMKEVKFLLPKPALAVRDVKPGQWVNMVQGNWRDVEPLQTIQAKAQVLEILSKWPLFGSSFFAVKRISDPKDRADHILALNRHGVHFIDLITHETLIHYPFSEVISTRKVKSEDGTLFLDMKCGNLMQQRITRLQTDQAHEISRLIRQYITMEQKLRS